MLWLAANGGDYMETETIVSLISSVGFPIVCCYFMWTYINTTLADFSKLMSENSASLDKLCDKIDLILIKVIGANINDEVTDNEQ